MNFFNMLELDQSSTLKKILSIMKLTVVFLIAFSLQISASVYSQTTKLSLNVQNQSIKDVLYLIENQSDFRFIYESGKINLDKKFYSFDSELNDVSKNVAIISPSDMPDVIGGTFILAAHSGNVNTAYFKRLNELVIGDVVSIYYSDIKYVYKISSFYEEKRNSSIVIKRERMKSVLVLTTCKIGTKKQLVYVANLVNKCNVDDNC